MNLNHSLCAKTTLVAQDIAVSRRLQGQCHKPERSRPCFSVLLCILPACLPDQQSSCGTGAFLLSCSGRLSGLRQVHQSFVRISTMCEVCLRDVSYRPTPTRCRKTITAAVCARHSGVCAPIKHRKPSKFHAGSGDDLPVARFGDLVRFNDLPVCWKALQCWCTLRSVPNGDSPCCSIVDEISPLVGRSNTGATPEHLSTLKVLISVFVFVFGKVGFYRTSDC